MILHTIISAKWLDNKNSFLPQQNDPTKIIPEMGEKSAEWENI